MDILQFLFLDFHKHSNLSLPQASKNFRTFPKSDNNKINLRNLRLPEINPLLSNIQPCLPSPPPPPPAPPKCLFYTTFPLENVPKAISLHGKFNFLPSDIATILIFFFWIKIHQGNSLKMQIYVITPPISCHCSISS